MASNVFSFKDGIKFVPVSSAPTGENGVMYYDSGLNKFRMYENGAYTNVAGGSGTVNSGVAGRLALYPSTGTGVDDVYVQNSQNIDVAIAAQGSRSAAIEYTIPNPGNAVTAADFVLTEGAQTINGAKTFSSDVVLQGNLTVQGTTTQVDTTNTNVKDKLITLNSGGAAASGGGSGLEIEENSSITGYIKTSAARTGFDLKAPATAGVATFVTDTTSRTYTLPAATGTLLTDVVQDTTPQLGGELDVNGNAIASASNGNIVVAPHGTGRVRLANQGALTNYTDEKYFHGTTLTASTTAVQSDLTFDTTVYKSQVVEYQIREATTNRTRVGKLLIAADGAGGAAASTLSIVDTGAETADTGVTFSAAMNGNDAEISYTTTANNKAMHSVVKRFLA
jgi:hypothetical protein